MLANKSILGLQPAGILRAGGSNVLRSKIAAMKHKIHDSLFPTCARSVIIFMMTHDITRREIVLKYFFFENANFKDFPLIN